MTKNAEVRRNELLDVALGLVQQVGYDAMSVEAVATAAGVAKGTFYHHFTSKEDLRFQLLERLGEQLHQYIAAALRTAPERGDAQLRVFMDAATSYKMGHLGQFLPMAFLYRPENDSLRHRLYQAWSQATRDLLVAILGKGIADESFTATDAEATADILTTVWYEGADRLWLRALGQADAAGFAEVLLHGSLALQQAQTRIVGLPDGTVTISITPDMTTGLQQVYHQVKELRS